MSFWSVPEAAVAARLSHESAPEDLLDALPLLASTQFCLGVLLQGPVLDLASVVEVLRFDPCALLRLFAAVHEVGGAHGATPQRLDECVLALGTAGLVHALRPAPSTWQQQARLNRFAEHGAAIAAYARHLAASLPLCGDTAFNAGLLHAIGYLPAELGRMAPPATRAQECTTAQQIACRYHLPHSLQQAVLSQFDPQAGEAWPALLQAAHELADPTHAQTTPFGSPAEPFVERHFSQFSSSFATKGSAR